jgi:argininosuccinate lyase
MKVIPIEGRAQRDRLRNAQDELRRACALLSSPSPDAMTACGRALKTAVTELQAWLPEGSRGRGDQETTEAVLALRRSVMQAQRLLQSAAEYQANWLQRMCVMTAGYTGEGQPAIVDPGSRMSLQA